MSEDAEATRHITRRDAREEGEPDVEPDAEEGTRAQAMKDTQRDLTSLSGPIHSRSDREPRDE